MHPEPASRNLMTTPGVQPPPPAFHHAPVLVEEIVSFVPPTAALLVDCTLGGGGHAEALLRQFPAAELFGCDRDGAAIASARERLAPFTERLLLRQMPFSGLDKQLLVGSVDFMLADLGASSHQFDAGERGFSFSQDGPLDMRMDPDSDDPTAADLVNTLSPAALTRLMFEYGEERFARRIAGAIEAARQEAPLETTGQLSRVISAVVPRTRNRRAIHPATRTFQALRIAVNAEMKELERLLEIAPTVIKPGGRLAVISFHSLEDRPVKIRFNTWERPCECPATLPYCICGKRPIGRRVTRKPVVPGTAEASANPRSRSAKLRVFEFTPVAPEAPGWKKGKGP